MQCMHGILVKVKAQTIFMNYDRLSLLEDQLEVWQRASLIVYKPIWSNKTACSNSNSIDVKHSRRSISTDDIIVTRNETRKSLASSVVIQTK